MPWRAKSALLLLAWAALWSQAALTSVSFIYTETPMCDLQAWSRGAERFPAGARLVVDESGCERILVARFFAAADPAVSFDGRTVLFAGRPHPQDRWGIWELALTGGLPPRPVFQASEDCIRPFYLPDERIVYSRHTADGWQIETFAPRDGKTLRLTYAPGNYAVSDVLQDGRILFEHEGEVYTVYSDGSGVESYRCDHGTPRAAPRQLASGDIVFEEPAGLGRFTSAQAREVTIPAPPGSYAGPVAELNPGSWLLSWRRQALERFSLYLWAPGGGVLNKVISDKADLVQPVVLAPRTPPKRFPSALHDWDGANLLCLNAYTARVPITEGAIATVRFYSLDAARQPVLLGEAPVESDGSFFVHVPADRPLRLELRDRSARAVQAEHDWFWLRRGEQRVCVGCHAGPERAPDNAVPQALKKGTVAFSLEVR